MTEYLPLIAVLLSMMTGGGFVALWVSLGSRISKAESTAATADMTALAAAAKHDVLARDVNEYRVEQATNVSRVRTMVEIQVAGLADAEKRMAKAIDDMGGRFDAMSGRLDNFAERVIESLSTNKQNR